MTTFYANAESRIIVLLKNGWIDKVDVQLLAAKYQFILSFFWIAAAKHQVFGISAAAASTTKVGMKLRP